MILGRAIPIMEDHQNRVIENRAVLFHWECMERSILYAPESWFNGLGWSGRRVIPRSRVQYPSALD